MPRYRSSPSAVTLGHPETPETALHQSTRKDAESCAKESDVVRRETGYYYQMTELAEHEAVFSISPEKWNSAVPRVDV
jgi:hypothetical protein